MLNDEVRIHELRLWNTMLSCEFITWTKKRFRWFITAMSMQNEHNTMMNGGRTRRRQRRRSEVHWCSTTREGFESPLKNTTLKVEVRYEHSFVLDFTMNWNENDASVICNQSALSLLLEIAEYFHLVGEHIFCLNPG